jgi:uncharacterized membrane protein
LHSTWTLLELLKAEAGFLSRIERIIPLPSEFHRIQTIAEAIAGGWFEKDVSGRGFHVSN